MRHRHDKDRSLQRIYTHYMANPPIMNGRRWRGSGMRCAFWDGVDGLARGNQPLYVRGSLAHAAYMAGKDSRDKPDVQAAERVPVAGGACDERPRSRASASISMPFAATGVCLRNAGGRPDLLREAHMTPRNEREERIGWLKRERACLQESLRLQAHTIECLQKRHDALRAERDRLLAMLAEHDARARR